MGGIKIETTQQVVCDGRSSQNRCAADHKMSGERSVRSIGDLELSQAALLLFRMVAVDC